MFKKFKKKSDTTEGRNFTKADEIKLSEYLDIISKPIMNKPDIDWADWLYYYALSFIERNSIQFDYDKIDFHAQHLEKLDVKIRDILDNEDHSNPEIIIKLLSVMKDYQR